MSHVAAIAITCRVNGKPKAFKIGESLDGVSPAALSSMIRLGQAVESGSVKAATKPAKPSTAKAKKGDE